MTNLTKSIKFKIATVKDYLNLSIEYSGNSFTTELATPDILTQEINISDHFADDTDTYDFDIHRDEFIVKALFT